MSRSRLAEGRPAAVLLVAAGALPARIVQEPLRLAPSVTWGKDFLVPADAEIIIEGTITPGERTVVDPFGEISGLYQEQQLAPVMRVTAITYRDGAVYQAS